MHSNLAYRKAQCFDLVADNLKYLNQAAKSPSFECKITLITAEIARIKKEEPKKIFELYDLSVKQAATHDYPHINALHNNVNTL